MTQVSIGEELGLEQFAALLGARRSVRGFLADEVPRDQIEAVLAAAQTTPSWCNAQPWRTYVLSGDSLADLRDRFAADSAMAPDYPFPPAFPEPFAGRRRESGWQLYDALGVVKGDREASARETGRNFEFFGAPHALILTAPASLGVYALVDVGAYLQSLLLALQAAGLGGCAQAAVALKAPVVRSFLALPDEEQVVCSVSFGYPDNDHASSNFRTNRADLSESVSWHD